MREFGKSYNSIKESGKHMKILEFHIQNSENNEKHENLKIPNLNYANHENHKKM